MNIGEIRSKLEGVQGSETKFKAKCPAHDDLRQSLSVEQGSKTVVMKCFAGCTFEQICEALDLDKPKPKSNKLGVVICEYPYRNLDGRIAFKVVRFEPKTFRPYHVDGGKWRMGLGNVERIPYRLPDWYDKTNIVFIVEGEKDADNLFKIGIFATTNQGGAENWKDDLAKWFNGKKVIICPDNDKAGDKWAGKIGQALCDVAESVQVLKLPVPDKGDVSDWLKNGGSQLQLVKLATEAPKFERQEKEAVKSGNSNSGISKFDPESVANQLPLETLRFREQLGFYRYEEKGIWREAEDTEVETMIFPHLPPPKNPHRFTATLRILKQKCYLHDPDGFNSHPELICLKNGVYNWKTRQFLNHNPKYLKRAQSPANWNPDAICPLWEEKIKEILVEDRLIQMLQEFIGLCFTPITKFHAAAIFTGAGRNGKSLVSEIIRYAVGNGNYASLSFEDFKNKFNRFMLYGKTLNLSTETNIGKRMDTGYFKAVVGGDIIMASKKHKPEINFKPCCKTIFATNDLPISTDTTEGYIRRLKIFPFNQRFEDAVDASGWNIADKALEEKLKKEIDGFVQWSMTGLHRLLENDDFTASVESKKAIEHYKYENNNVLYFFDDWLTLDENEFLFFKDVMALYNEICEKNNFLPVDVRAVSKRLINAFPGQVFSDKKYDHESGKTIRCIKGVTWKDLHQAKELVRLIHEAKGSNF